MIGLLLEAIKEMIMKTIRDGKIVWPYCESCGCRLDYTDYSRTEYKFYHFSTWTTSGDFSDGRGHSCKNLFQAWILPKYRFKFGV